MNKKIKPLLAKKGITIKETLKIIDEGALGVALVVDKKNRFLGLVTDGDVRRAIIKGNSVDTRIEEIIPKSQIVVKEGISNKKILELMSNEIRHIPIIDKSGRIVDLASYVHFFSIPVAEPHLVGKEIEYVLECIKTGWVSSQGKFVKRFEREFSKYCGTRFATSTCNGTVALHLALAALGIGQSDEVIIPDLTFAATASAVKYTGAKPIFVDSEPDTWNIDPEKIEEKLTKKTKAIIPVHLYGHPANMDPILNLAKKYNLFVIEDACEAHGAEYKGKKVGSIGDIGCFSFFGNKIITTGEGGMCITNKLNLIKKMQLLKNHGMSPKKKYWHSIIGFNYRLTNIQAALGLAQLSKIDNIITVKRRNAKLYSEFLKEVKGITLPPEKRWAKNVYWMYSVLVEKDFPISKEKLMKKLKQNNIDTRPLFYPLHKMPPFRTREDYPVAEEISRKGLSLPSSINLTEADIKYISDAIKKAGKR